MNLSVSTLTNLSDVFPGSGDTPALNVNHLNACSCWDCCSTTATADFSSDGSVAEEDFTLQSETFRWQQPGGKGSPITLKYSFTNLFNGGIQGSINNAQIKDAIEEAFELWSSYAPLNFVEVEDTGVKSRNNPDAADIRLGHEALDGKGGTLGRARLTFDGVLATNIVFDSQDRWATDRTATESDFLYVAAHEIGHSLGLRHELVNDALMRATTRDVYSGLGSAFLYNDDIEGIRALFGQGVGSVTPISGGGSTPPPPPPADDDVVVIGTEGRDVLRGTAQSQTFRARGGNDRVLAGGGDDTVRGGLGADTLSGDAGDDLILGDGGRDLLTGGTGNDQLRGGIGNDRLVGVNASAAKPGANEIDILIGGADRDVFVLGDRTNVYYDDGRNGTAGTGDYAFIQDFNSRAGDKIQLNGDAASYRLGSAPAGTRPGRGLFLLNANGPDELIAVISKNNNLTLDSQSFSFV